MKEFGEEGYWQSRYEEGKTGWNIGYPAPALMDYVEKNFNEDAKILIPGCGFGHEVIALYNQGYPLVFGSDISPSAVDNIKKVLPTFPDEQILIGDFFELTGTYDLILEQTFFCALNPQQRPDYVQKMASLLTSGGVLAGLLFSTLFEKDGPPFGGTKQEYIRLFSNDFDILYMEEAKNSIPERLGNELFFELQKK